MEDSALLFTHLVAQEPTKTFPCAPITESNHGMNSRGRQSTIR